MTEEILSAQGLSWTQLGLAALVLVVLLWQGYRWMLYPIPTSRKALLLTCRVIWTLLLLWCIWDPVLQKTQTHKKTVLPKVITVVDQSASMSFKNDTKNREEELHSILNKLKTTLNESQVKDSVWLGIGSNMRPLADSPVFQDQQSLILKNLQEASEQHTDSQTPAAIFLLTDGQDTTEAHISSVLPSLRANKAQVYPILWKELAQIPLFVRIERILAPGEVLVNHTFDLQSEIRIRTSEPLDLDVILSSNGKEIARQSYPQARNGTIRTSFSLKSDKPELALYTISIKPTKKDATLSSMSTAVRFKNQDKIKILYVQGKLDFEFRFVKGALWDNPSFQLDGMSQMNNESRLHQVGSKTEQTSATDISSSIRTAPEHYHVVVLKNIAKNDLDEGAQKALLELVQKKGGGILFFSGNSVEASSLKETVLEELLPITFEATTQEEKSDNEFSKKFTSQFGLAKKKSSSETPMTATADEPQFSLKLTEEGSGSEIWRDATTPNSPLPEPPKTFDYFVKIQALKPGAMLLGVQREDPQQRPLFACQNIGAGRSAFLGIDGLRRWRLSKDAKIRDYDRFWQQLFLWLGGRIQTTNLELDKSRYQPGETAKITFKTQNPDPEYQLTVKNPSGSEDAIPLHWNNDSSVGTAEYPIRSAGEHVLTVKKKLDIMAQSIIDSASTDLEREYSGLNETLLQQLAKETGGRCIDPSEFDIIPQLLKQREETHTERQRTSLWHTPWIFLAMLIFYGIELMLRRRFLLT